METNLKRTYEIVGRTKSSNFVVIGFCSSIEIAADLFLKKYPRFKGIARIKTQMAQDVGKGMLCVDGANWETVYEFKCNKELQIIVDGLQKPQS
jgi:hypothetical protein